jgi:hypothetical protein
MSGAVIEETEEATAQAPEPDIAASEAAGCCSSTKQSSCCDPSEKASCCGNAASGGCGCQS